MLVTRRSNFQGQLSADASRNRNALLFYCLPLIFFQPKSARSHHFRVFGKGAQKQQLLQRGKRKRNRKIDEEKPKYKEPS